MDKMLGTDLHPFQPIESPEPSDEEFFSDTGSLRLLKRKKIRTSKNRFYLKHGMPLASAQSPVQKRLALAKTLGCCCLGSEIDIEAISMSCRSDRIPKNLLKIDNIYHELLHVRFEKDEKQCFIFRFGCVVIWDCDVSDFTSLVFFIRPYIIEPLSEEKIEKDDLRYTPGDMSHIRGDVIYLKTSTAFEKIAYSYALAQSVKLAYFEEVIDDLITDTRHLPENLARTGKIDATRTDLSKKMGALFVNRFFINLHTDILDTPDLLWDNDDYEPHYEMCRKYLEIPPRVAILNQRLDVIKDLYDIIYGELTIQHGNKLEWIIIVLICMEVAIEVFWNIIIKDLLKLV